ncbi:hypothetical protein KIN20_028402 [Parelaphostrongylus tenuis]|uniref:Uncharacterized protein n=1 Tax=Parelaphostrongylus tenuis TaxID=148309 RepID=A0AAD5R1J0_PARTN|nr:hypothetical protein KIN20_028402 [Parelaphostrongylus tenuis]
MSQSSYDNKRAYENEYQDRLRHQQHNDGQRPLLNPGQPASVTDTRRNCLPRQLERAGQRNDCRQRIPTQPPSVYIPAIKCRPAMPSISPTPQLQRRINCIRQRHTPTYPPLSSKCQVVKEFRSSPDLVTSPPTNFDCEGSVKIVSVNADGVVEHYTYKTGKDVGEVPDKVSGKVADRAENTAENTAERVGDAADDAKEHASRGLSKTGEALGDAGVAVKDAAVGVAEAGGDAAVAVKDAAVDVVGMGVQGVGAAVGAVVGVGQVVGGAVSEVAGTVKMALLQQRKPLVVGLEQRTKM